MASNKHSQHISGGNLGVFGCSDCHVRTVQSNNTTIIYANGKHVDGTKTVALKSFNSYTGYYDSSSHTCRNAYCHSSGQSTPNFRTTPDWTSASTLDCDGCHGADNFYTLAAGAPDYENISTTDRNEFNSHQVHVAQTSDCVKCHDLTVDSGEQIIASSEHLSGSRDVHFAKGGSYDSTLTATA